MSHFTKIKTKIADKHFLIKALKNLGYVVEEGMVNVGGYGRTFMGIKVFTKTRGHIIGFQKKGNFYEVVADWDGIKDVNRDKFLKTINQRYAYIVAKTKLEEQGFSLVEEKIESDERIHLLLRRTV
jgi:uncharacterized protein (UPF0128 family)